MTQPYPHGVVDAAASVTEIVLKALSRTPDPRRREIMATLVMQPGTRRIPRAPVS